MTEIIVANKNTYKQQDGDYPIYIHRGYTLGNPFRIGPDGTREEVIQKFRKELESNEQIKNYLKVYVKGIERGFCKRLVLLCFCTPRACHGDVIKEYLEKQIDTSS